MSDAEAIFLSVVAAMIVAAGAGAWRYRAHLTLTIRAMTIDRNRTFRFSIAALLQVPAPTGGFLLFRMQPTRAEAFAPPGGVRKYFPPSAAGRLQELEWEPEFPPQVPGEHAGDLRGHLPGRKVPAFLLWVDKTTDIENDTDALRRELREECPAVNVAVTAEMVASLNLRTVRKVQEVTRQETRIQVRLISVLEPVAGDRATDQLIAAIVAGIGADVIVATQQEIRTGRSAGGVPIASSAEYLLGGFTRRPELPPLVT
jgi:hypothetical protein